MGCLLETEFNCGNKNEWVLGKNCFFLINFFSSFKMKCNENHKTQKYFIFLPFRIITIKNHKICLCGFFSFPFFNTIFMLFLLWPLKKAAIKVIHGFLFILSVTVLAKSGFGSGYLCFTALKWTRREKTVSKRSLKFFKIVKSIEISPKNSSQQFNGQKNFPISPKKTFNLVSVFYDFANEKKGNLYAIFLTQVFVT